MLDRRLFLFSLAAPLYRATPLQTFSSEEAKPIEALCDQIIPADEDGPGAKFAGVLFYIDQQLAGPLKRFADSYRNGLIAVNYACQRATGRAFADLAFEVQTGFLMSLEKEGPSDALTFFRLVTEHTMQGYYGHPGHGGNRDEVSWKMLGIQETMEGHRH